MEFNSTFQSTVYKEQQKFMEMSNNLDYMEQVEFSARKKSKKWSRDIGECSWQLNAIESAIFCKLKKFASALFKCKDFLVFERKN